MEFEFNLTEQKVNLILEGLGKLPAEKSIHLILELQESAKQQIVEKQKLKEIESASNRES